MAILYQFADSTPFDYLSGNGQFPQFVDVHDYSERGVRVESSAKLRPAARLAMQFKDSLDQDWQTLETKVIWTRQKSGDGLCMAGLEIIRALEPAQVEDLFAEPTGKPEPTDLDFLLNTKLLRGIPRHAVCPFLNCLGQKTALAGQRLMSQGDQGDTMCLIHSGACSVKVEKGEEQYGVARLRPGDVAGEMAVLTGEPRSAHLDAESDVVLWELSQKQFDRVSAAHPDLRLFLSELVSNRLETSPFTADRSVGRYLIKDKIGQGGWSIVYQGVHRKLNMPVAVKMLKHNLAMDEDFIENFKNEGKLIARLNHRNIVKIFDIEERYRTLFIVMELMEGETLESHLVKTGRIDPGMAAEYLVQTLEGLRYAHRLGVIHQDIKPANLFLEASGRIKVLDFGLACSPGEEDVDLTGTLYYMPPEKILGEAVDQRSDIYSLGITAFEMVTGQRPYPEDDLGVLTSLHVRQDIPDPAGLAPDLPERLRAFILKACQRKPKDRYQSADEARQALAPLAGEHSQSGAGEALARRKITSLFLIYHDELEMGLKHLLDEFSTKAEDLGVIMKMVEVNDL